MVELVGLGSRGVRVECEVELGHHGVQVVGRMGVMDRMDRRGMRGTLGSTSNTREGSSS